MSRLILTSEFLSRRIALTTPPKAPLSQVFYNRCETISIVEVFRGGFIRPDSRIQTDARSTLFRVVFYIYKDEMNSSVNLSLTFATEKTNISTPLCHSSSATSGDITLQYILDLRHSLIHRLKRLPVVKELRFTEIAMLREATSWGRSPLAESSGPRYPNHSVLGSLSMKAVVLALLGRVNCQRASLYAKIQCGEGDASHGIFS